MWITKKGYNTLLQKRVLLDGKRKELLAQLGEEAEKDFDLPENAVWKQLQVELRFNLPYQMAELQKLISESQIIEDVSYKLNGDKKVCLGSKARIKLDDKERIVVLVGPYDLNVIENGVSYLSPLGKAMLGAENGEEITFETPKGERQITILSVEREL